MISYLQPTTLVAVTVVLLRLTHKLVGYNITDCYAPDQVDHYNACNVSYLDRVRFHCPAVAGRTGAWFRNDTLVCKHESPVCEIQRQLHYDDSGIYYCYFQNRTYYVNLKVLAPPFLLNVIECSGSSCERSSVDVDTNSLSFQVIVEYAGVGPFNVSWTRNGHKLQCIPEDQCDPSDSHCCLSIPNDKKQVITVQSEYTAADKGFYAANVTNALGWNVSTERVRIDCFYPDNPMGFVRNYTHLTPGQNEVRIKCWEFIEESVELYMCYAQPGVTFSDLDRNGSCIQCDPYTSGRCKNTILAKPEWVVSRDNYTTGFCKTNQRTTLTIPFVHKEDSGTVYCYYSYSLNSAQLYMAYDLSVDLPTHLPVIIGSASGGTLIVLILLTFTACGCYYFRRQRIESEEELINSAAIVRETERLIGHQNPPPARYGQQARVNGIRKQRKSRPPALPTQNGSYASESIASDDEESEESDYFSPKYIPKPKPTVKKTYATSGITISVTQEGPTCPLLTAGCHDTGEDYGSTDCPDPEVHSDFLIDTSEQQMPV